jgi:hypothetical protein
MPDTAREAARELGRDDVAALDDEALRHRLTTDGELNLALGGHYLGKQLARYGSPAQAPAAYNAGPGRVDEWLAANGDPRTGAIAEGEWVERIPFQETRDYVRRVMADAGLGDGPGALLRRVRLAALPKALAAARALEQAGRKQRVERQGDALGDTVYLEAGGHGGDLGAMLARIRTMPGLEPALVERATARLEHRHEEGQKVAKARAEEAYARLWEQLQAGKAPAELEPNLVRLLTPQQKEALEARHQQLRKGVEPVTDFALYHHLRTMPPAELAQVNLLEFRPFLANTELKELTDRQERARSGQLETMPRDLDRQVADTIRILDLTRDEQKGRFSSEVHRAVAAEEQRLGKRLSFDEAQRIVDRLAIKVSSPDWWRSGRLFELDPGQTYHLTESQLAEQREQIARATGVPAEHVGPIAAALRAAGLDVTIEAIRELWLDRPEQ